MIDGSALFTNGAKCFQCSWSTSWHRCLPVCFHNRPADKVVTCNNYAFKFSSNSKIANVNAEAPILIQTQT